MSAETFIMRFYDGNMRFIAEECINTSKLRYATNSAQNKASSEMHYCHYQVTNGDGGVLATGNHGYDITYAIRDLLRLHGVHKARPAFAGWEMDTRGFRALVEHGYIEPSANHFEHEAGYWQYTDKGNTIARYLKTRQRREWKPKRLEHSE